MSNEEFDSQFARALELSLPPFSAHVKARALEAMARCRSVRARSRSRIIAIAVGAAMVLFALGFVPFPCGSAKGAVAKAMAAAEQIVTVHFIKQSTDENGNKYMSETWADDQGFYRRDDIDNGKLTWTIMYRGTTFLSFYAPKSQAFEVYYPQGASRQSQGEDTAFLEMWQKQPFFESLTNSSYYDDVKINEYQERTLWGGLVTVAEIKAVIYPKELNGKPYAGQTKTYRLEIDPATDRIMKATEEFIAGTKDHRAETIYEWEVPIPDSAREFTPPAGTKLTRDLWWQDKADKVVAQASTQDWEVVLHDIQVDSKGNIVASLSTRHLVTDENSRYGLNGAVIPDIVVDDNVGNKYYGQHSGSVFASFGHSYLILPVIKTAGERSQLPLTATFTIHPYPAGEFSDQTVVFKDVPLPERQPLDMEDLLHQNNEVVQY